MKLAINNRGNIEFALSYSVLVLESIKYVMYSPSASYARGYPLVIIEPADRIKLARNERGDRAMIDFDERPSVACSAAIYIYDIFGIR